MILVIIFVNCIFFTDDNERKLFLNDKNYDVNHDIKPI